MKVAQFLLFDEGGLCHDGGHTLAIVSESLLQGWLAGEYDAGNYRIMADDATCLNIEITAIGMAMTLPALEVVGA